MNPVTVIVLTSALIVAAVIDYRRQRIPNWLTVPLFVAGFGWHFYLEGPQGLLFALYGAGLGFGLMLVPYLLGFMGGGDVKVMAAIGAWLGTGDGFAAFLFSAAAGGVYAVVIMLSKRGIMRQLAQSMWRTFWLFLTTKRIQSAPSHTGENALPKLCYGVAIALGTILYMVHVLIQNGAGL